MLKRGKPTRPAVSLADLNTALPALAVASQIALPPELVRFDKAATYSRFSTDRQNEHSIERQQEANNKHAGHIGALVVGEYVDRGRTGSNVNRPGLQELLKDARAGAFNIVIFEDIDRFSRDVADLTTMHKELTLLGIEVHCVSLGRAISSTEAALFALMAQQDRERTIYRLTTGREHYAKDGGVLVSDIYGYHRVDGEFMVHNQEAETVKFIFDEFENGVRPDQIARILNARKVPTARGGVWRGVNIIGAQNKGLLRNPRYAGFNIYLRTRYKKDPVTGVTNVEFRPQSDWIVTMREDLEIIPLDQMKRVQEIIRVRDEEAATIQQERARRRAGKSSENERLTVKHRIKTHFLSGMLKCARCGGAMAKSSHRGNYRIRCERYTKGRSCEAGRTIMLRFVEFAAVSALREILSDKKYLAAYADEIRQTRKEKSKKIEEDRARLNERADKVSKELNETVNLVIAKSLTGEWFEERIRNLNSEFNSIRDILRKLPVDTSGDFSIDLKGAATLADAIENLLIEPLIDMSTAEGAVLVAQLARLIPRIEIDAPAGASITVRITVEMGSLSGRHGEQELLSICRTVDPIAGRANPVDAERARILENRGEHNLTDEEWELIKDDIPHTVTELWGAKSRADARNMIDASSYILRYGVKMFRLPQSFGDKGLVHQAFQAMIRVGAHVMIYDKLSAEWPERFSDYDARYLETLSSPAGERSPKSRALGVDLAERAKSGSHRLSDRDARLLEPLLSDEKWAQLRSRGDLALLLEAGLFIMKENITISALPDCYGTYKEFLPALKAAVWSGFWDEAIRLLLDADPKRFDRWNTGRFDLIARSWRVVTCENAEGYDEIHEILASVEGALDVHELLHLILSKRTVRPGTNETHLLVSLKLAMSDLSRRGKVVRTSRENGQPVWAMAERALGDEPIKSRLGDRRLSASCNLKGEFALTSR